MNSRCKKLIQEVVDEAEKAVDETLTTFWMATDWTQPVVVLAKQKET